MNAFRSAVSWGGGVVEELAVMVLRMLVNWDILSPWAAEEDITADRAVVTSGEAILTVLVVATVGGVGSVALNGGGFVVQ